MHSTRRSTRSGSRSNGSGLNGVKRDKNTQHDNDVINRIFPSRGYEKKIIIFFFFFLRFCFCFLFFIFHYLWYVYTLDRSAAGSF